MNSTSCSAIKKVETVPLLADYAYEDILYRVVKKGFDAGKVQLTPQPEA